MQCGRQTVGMKDTVLFVILLNEDLTQFLKQQYQAMNVQSDVEISVKFRSILSL
jgi:hypothetical protein